ncbi:MAG TPA: MBL fold metallo-hydrolase, partial [Candidatus Gemmiger excrementipullorum]|nr:MBL fold metallo-hydrolase [Candidatus Gemmiger excrementipullorum]
MLTVTMLGCGGTQPLPGRALAALAVQAAGHGVLLDCGEGTQTALRRWGVSAYRLAAVLLTHYHGDHILGLPGLLQTLGSLGRTAPLVIAGPAAGQQGVADAVAALAGALPFAVQWRAAETPFAAG